MKFLATILLSGLLVSTAFSQSTKPNRALPRPGKPKPAATPPRKASETPEWEKATAIADARERIAALKKFSVAFPRSTRVPEALALISAAEAALGNERLAAGDGDAAAEFLRAASNDAPKPVPDQLFSDTLVRFPANLYFRGMREAGFEIAKILEGKADASASQLLSIAGFYLSVENGAEARRVAENAIKLDPTSSAGYQTLGLANRLDFKLEESAATYTKALELDPDSLTARRGLAEMKRSLGKSDEAVTLYREILSRDETNLPARTGLILALFDAERRPDAETEMAKSLEANPGNVILLAGAAYWYAVHDEGAQAVALAQKAIEADPRFIWSHIALARGFMSQKKPLDAERTLLAARRYGNFPTLEYEIASARLAAGLYRETAEELSKSFSVKDGVIHADLGGRVPGESKYFTELVGFERRASIFAPTAADNPESADQMRALLEFEQELGSDQPRSEILTRAADGFIRGDDKMKVHRQIFAASRLLDKKAALPKVLEITKAAPQSLEAGLNIPDPATAVMASELYESRAIAGARGEYVNVPNVPRPTLSAVLRGRIEEISGWALYQMDDAAEATVHLKRAVGVLPADSAWWRSSTWRLGTALVVNGEQAEALEFYIRSYKSSGPDVVRYNAIESLYRQVKGNTLGLEERIGPNPSPPVTAETVAKKIEPTPDINTTPPSIVPIKADPTPDRETVPETSSTAAATTGSTPPAEVKTDPTPELVGKYKPIDESPVTAIATPTVIPAEQIMAPSPTPEIKAEPIPDGKEQPAATPGQGPVAIPTIPTDVAPAPIESPTPAEAKPTNVTEAFPNVTGESTPDLRKTPEEKPKETPGNAKATTRELFPPIVITIPQPETTKAASREVEAGAEPVPSPTGTKPAGETTATPTTSTPPAEIKPSMEPTAAPSAPPEVKADESKPAATPTPESRTDDAPIPDDGRRSRIVETKPETPAEIKPCTLTVSEESLTLQNGGSDLAVIVGREGDADDLEGLMAVSTSPQNVTVRREIIEGIKARALFVVRSVSASTGIYQVRFEMPCGKKEIVVKVR